MLCAVAGAGGCASAGASYEPSPSPGRVIAVGDGVALVSTGAVGDVRLFSLGTGEPLRTMRWPFVVGDASFDGEFWGEGVSEAGGVLWRLKGKESEVVTVATPCKLVLGVFKGLRGERLFTCSPSGKITQKASLMRWDSLGGLTMLRDLPAPWPNSVPNYFEGDEGPYLRAGAYVVDVCTDRATQLNSASLPPLSAGETWVETRMGSCGDWLLGAEHMSSLWVARDGGKASNSLPPIPSTEGDLLGTFLAPAGDRKLIYALVRREAAPTHFELLVTRNLGGSWELRGPRPSDPVPVWNVANVTVGLRLFPVSDGVWIQLEQSSPDGAWSIEMVFYGNEETADRSVTLRGRIPQ